MRNLVFHLAVAFIGVNLCSGEEEKSEITNYELRITEGSRAAQAAQAAQASQASQATQATQATQTRPAALSTDHGTLSIANDPFRYSGCYDDYESGFYYCKARYYSPLTQSFTSRDTYDLANRYAYCEDNPVMYSDPEGHSKYSHLFTLLRKNISRMLTERRLGRNPSQCTRTLGYELVEALPEEVSRFIIQGRQISRYFEVIKRDRCTTGLVAGGRFPELENEVKIVTEEIGTLEIAYAALKPYFSEFPEINRLHDKLIRQFTTVEASLEVMKQYNTCVQQAECLRRAGKSVMR